ncbi:MAG: polyhydroxybutyrate depolymerase [Pseudomonadota bacterium]
MKHTALTTVVLLLAACGDATDERTPVTVVASESAITVSGFSSGGYMATQLHIAHSDRISGLGVVAAGPYWCSKGNLQRALTTSMAGCDIGIDQLTHHAREEAAVGRLATMNNLRGSRVWIFRGQDDTVVSDEVSYAAVEFYEQLGDGKLVAYIDTVAAPHGFPTLATGADCAEMTTPFINACDYDAAGAMLTHVTGIQATATPDASGTIRRVDQSAFTSAGLASEGLMYVPSHCDSVTCDLHVALHGCQQSTEFVDRRFVELAGYNRWADAMNLVVFYPQVATSAVNPLGCWDWWGYTGPDFAVQDGPQITALMALIDSLIAAAP